MDSRKAAFLYLSVSVLAMLVTACAGFKAELIEGAKDGVSVLTPRGNTGNGGSSGTGGTDNYVSPAYNVQITNSMPIINFMASQNPEVMDILNDENFMGPPYIAGRMSLHLQNVSTNSVSGGVGSQLRFQGILSGAAGVEIRMESTDARVTLNLNASQFDYKMQGSWNFPTDHGVVQLEINANPVRNMVATSGAYDLQGNLWARFGNSQAAELLGTFSIPVCAVMTDTSWIRDAQGNVDPAANCGALNP